MSALSQELHRRYRDICECYIEDYDLADWLLTCLYREMTNVILHGDYSLEELTEIATTIGRVHLKFNSRALR